MCYNSYNVDYGESAGHTDVYANCALLCGNNRSDAANDFDQRYLRNMVTGCQQHGFSNLYVHAERQSMRDHDNNGPDGDPANAANLYTDCCILLRNTGSYPSGNFR